MALGQLPSAHEFDLDASGQFAPAERHLVQDPLGWFCCFISFTMLLLISWSASRPGAWTTTLVVLLFLLPWGWIILRQPQAALGAVRSNWFLLALPVLAVTSTLWSDHSEISLRSGVQYFVTIVIGILAGSCLRPRTVVSALLSALFLLAIVSILDGSAEYNAYTGEYTLIGVFGSKNYFAVCMSFLLLTAISAAFDSSQAMIFRVIGIISIAVAAPLLVYARSVGALVISVATLLICLVLRLLIRLPVKLRIACLALLFLSTSLVLIVSTLDVSYADFLNYFGKDVTLTGRTLLWQYATAAIGDRPFLGGGYEAFWQPGNNSAEQLWYYSYVTNKYGYHFHNTYLQITVDLGFLGLTLFVLTLAGLAAKVIARLSFSRPSAEQLFAISLFIFLTLRTPIEVDLFFQFQLASILFCMIWVYLSRTAGEAVTHTQMGQWSNLDEPQRI